MRPSVQWLICSRLDRHVALAAVCLESAASRANSKECRSGVGDDRYFFSISSRCWLDRWHESGVRVTHSYRRAEEWNMKPLSITVDPDSVAGTAAAPTREQLAQQAAKWFEDIREFRSWEDGHLYGDHIPTSLENRMHRYQLSALMTEGETILLGITLNGEAQSLGGGLTLECIEANQRCLQLAFLDWHGDMP